MRGHGPVIEFRSYLSRSKIMHYPIHLFSLSEINLKCALTLQDYNTFNFHLIAKASVDKGKYEIKRTLKT